MKTNNILKIVFCAVLLISAVFAQQANATTGTWYGDTIGTRAFYNQKALQNGYTLIPTAFDGQGHVSNDAVTAQKMCELAGFNTVISRDCFEFGASGRCNFTSCANNVMGVWNTSTNNIDLVNACGHTWLASLTCGNTQPPSVCSTNSQCGTSGLIGDAFCQGNGVYKNYKTYTCNNPGTANATCSSTTTAQLQNTCTANQTCSNGSCVDQQIACSSNSQCGSNGFIGSSFCQSNDVYRNYKTWTCNNPGTTQSFCSSDIDTQLQNNCTANQTCSGGTCHDQNITCSTNSQCGTNGLTGFPFCQNGNVYQNYRTHTCNNVGTANSNCSYGDTAQLQTTCTANQTCSNGQCNNNPVSQTTTPTQTQTQTQNNNQVVYVNTPTPTPVYTVNPNYYNNYNNNYTNPATIQTTQATNIQNNQATLNGYLYTNTSANFCTNYVWFQWGTTTAYGNTTNQQAMNSTSSFFQGISGVYSGNTYHFRAVGRDCSGNAIYGQDQTFYVYPQVLGASSVSTGLTNNFWVDSFILPLILTLIGIWILKSGMFFSAEKKLNKRIANIKRLEQI